MKELGSLAVTGSFPVIGSFSVIGPYGPTYTDCVSSYFLPAAKPTGLVEVSGFFFFLLSVRFQKKVETAKINMVK